MRDGTRLTGRGLALLILGTIAAVAAAAIGERDLLWVTLFVAFLPVFAFAHLRWTTPGVTFTRTLTPPTVPLGSTSRVVLHVTNRSPGQGGALRFTDEAPSALADPASFTIARGFGAWRQAVGYTLHAEHRGRFPIGPLRGRACDPFGLAYRTFTARGPIATLRVTPQVWDLTLHTGADGLGASGDATPQRIGQAGADDVLVREHRHGDDIRRVHWKLSAKKDELMVRLDEHPWDPSSTLIVDTRRLAHTGGGPRGSLEWTISAVTSAAARLIEGRNRVSIVGPAGTVFQSGHSGQGAHQLMLEAMTELTPSGESWLGSAVADPESWTAAAALIAVTGRLDAADAAALVAVGGRARSLLLVAPQLDRWSRPSPEHDDALRMLRGHGWQVVTYAPGETVTDVWRRVLP